MQEGSSEGHSKVKRSRLSGQMNDGQHESTLSDDSVGGVSTPEPRPVDPSPPPHDNSSYKDEQKKLGKLSVSHSQGDQNSLERARSQNLILVPDTVHDL